MPFDVTERLCPTYFLPNFTAFLPEYFSDLLLKNPLPLLVKLAHPKDRSSEIQF